MSHLWRHFLCGSGTKHQSTSKCFRSFAHRPVGMRNLRTKLHVRLSAIDLCGITVCGKVKLLACFQTFISHLRMVSRFNKSLTLLRLICIYFTILILKTRKTVYLVCNFTLNIPQIYLYQQPFENISYFLSNKQSLNRIRWESFTFFSLSIIDLSYWCNLSLKSCHTFIPKQYFSKVASSYLFRCLATVESSETVKPMSLQEKASIPYEQAGVPLALCSTRVVSNQHLWGCKSSLVPSGT